MTQIFELGIFSWCYCGNLPCVRNLLVGASFTYRLLHDLYPPLNSLSKLVKSFTLLC